jgi:DnaA family protein
VTAIARGERNDSIWLAGPASSGKTHLLSAACHTAGEVGLRPMYLALEPGGDPAALADLDAIDLLALDDVDRIAGLPDWEAALFPVLNARLDRGNLVMAALAAPGECGFALADLASRAAAAAIYRLSVPTEDELPQAVIRQAAQRGLDLDLAAANYLLLRLSRDLGELTRWLDRIDQFALAQQRRITIPLLRDLIGADPRAAS